MFIKLFKLMKYRFLFIILLFFSIHISAQEKWEFSTSTPYKTVKSHFYFLEKGTHYNPEIASYTLTPIKNKSENYKEALIVKLYEVLKVLKLNVENIPDRRKGILQKNVYYLFENEPKIYLQFENNNWLYSEETVNAIPDLYNKYVLKSDKRKKHNQQVEEKIIHEKLRSDSGRVKLDLSSPFHTISSHLIFLSDSLFDPETAAKTINFAPKDTADAPELAIKLKQIFQAAKVQLFNFDSIPRNPNYIDTLSGKAIYHPNPELPQLYLEKVGNKWMYSRVTSKLIRSVHEQMYSGGAENVFQFSDRFKRIAGKYRNNILFGNFKVWQLLMLFYFIVLLIILILLNKYLVNLIFSRFNWYEPYKKVSFKIFKILTYLIFFNILAYYAPSFEFSVEYNFILLRIISLFIIVFNTTIAFYVVDFFREFFTRGHTYDNVYGIVLFSSLIVKTIILITGLLFIIKELNYNVVNFLAGLSIGGFALALGAQDTIKNFLASLMIFADKSFNVGDWIDNNKVSGTVEEIGLRSTKIRTFYNSLVTVPNSMLADQIIDNLGKRKYRRYKTFMIVKYDTPNEKILELIDRLKDYISKHKHTRKDYFLVNMHDFDRYGIEIIIYTFFKVKDYGTELQCRQDIIGKALEYSKELGIEFAVPADVHAAKD